MTDKEIEVIVKLIFAKMFNSNFSACEYGIECYKKGMEYYANILVEFANEITKELEKENAELKEENAGLKDKLEHRNCVDCSNHGSNAKLLKAKELLRKFLNAKNIEETCVVESEAEQFLKDSEV